MKKPLLDIVFFSEKRKNTLLLLKDGAREMETILRSLNTTRQALLPQIKIMEDSNLVIHKGRDAYELTILGKMLVDRMNPLLDTLTVLDKDVNFWGEHNLSFIPPHLFKRLRELTPCNVITNIPSTGIYEPDESIVEKARNSKVQTSVTTFLYPNFASILADFNERGVKMRLIVSEELLSKIEHEMDEVRGLLNNEFHEVFVYLGEMGFMSFGTNDFCFMMRMLTKVGNYDQTYVTACNPSAIQWGKELFEHYLKQSTKVNDL
ncbi:MAG: winged helix-turn-helix domain-containing protein [Methanolobus sp.]|nr:winged helix-turn-helix domain-containing protein [Methanolobus sp.]